MPRRKNMNRHQARELAFCLLFEHEFDKPRTMKDVYDAAKEARDAEENKYVRATLAGIAEHEEELEAMIEEAAEGWSIARISRVSLAILKLCAYEMFFCPDIPIRVSLNEAIELVKTYGEDNAKNFVNGILNTVSKKAAALRDGE